VGKQKVVKARTRLYVALVLTIAMLVPVVACGCGASTPEAAVRNYYQAISDHDWNAYLNSILPSNVRRMTSSDIQSVKESFEGSEIKYSDLKFKTVMDKSDKDKAEVLMIAGKISFRNPNTGEKTTMTVAEIKRTYNINASDETARFKGAWYVDVPMASADTETQQQ
jgi:hypothetical protein